MDKAGAIEAAAQFGPGWIAQEGSGESNPDWRNTKFQVN